MGIVHSSKSHKGPKVGPIPSAPIFTVAPPTVSAVAGTQVNFTAYDPDGTSIIYSLVLAPAGVGYSIAANGVVTLGSASGSIIVRATNAYGLYTDARCEVTIQAAGAWQLPGDGVSSDSHWLAAKMPAVIVHPRPAAECNAWERHLMAPASQAWSIPVDLQGGAWPFRYSVDATSAAKGITIGETLGSQDYGVLTWANPTIGTHTITVTVETQESGRNVSGFSEPAPLTWTLSVYDRDDTTRFIYLDVTNGNDANSGAYSSPKQTLSSVFDSTAYGGRQLFLRAGTYPTNGAAQFTPNATHPMVIVEYPGESVTVSWTQRNFSIGAGGFYWGVSNGAEGGWGAAQPNPRYFTSSNRSDRFTWMRFWMQNPSNGTLNSDNPSTIMFPGLGASSTVDRKYFVLHECKETGRIVSGSGNCDELFVLYGVDYVVIQSCEASGATGLRSMFPKDANNYCTIRNCRITGAFTGTGCQVQTQVTSGNIEYCWNIVHEDLAGNSVSSSVFRWAIQGSAGVICGPHFIYRNTFVNNLLGNQTAVNGLLSNTAGCGPFYVERNVIQTPNAPRVATGSQVVISFEECEGSSVVDANYILTGAYVGFRGTRGHEVVA